jgi:hypothetical protein
MKLYLVLIVVLSACCSVATAMGMPRASAVPGGVAVVDVGAATEPMPAVSFENRRVLTVVDGGRYKAIVGIALATSPGQHALTVKTAGATRSVPVKVKPKKYREQQLKVPDKQVNLAPEEEARVATEQNRVRALFDAAATRCLPRWRWLPPRTGRAAVHSA